MSSTTSRVLALLEILQGGGTRTVGELADRLGVDERTVRRYVAHLLDLDIPVRSVRGRYGGYRLAPGYRLPPLMFTDDEALAVLVSLVTGSGSGASPLAVESAAAKVRRVLPKALASRLGALLDVADLPERPEPDPTADVDVLLLVAGAARAGRSVEIVHTGRGGRTTTRTIDPYGVASHAGHWYVTGLDATSQEVRTFRLDRVRTARLGSGSFVVPTGFRPRAAVLDALARNPWRHEVSVRVHADMDTVLARLPPGIATVTRLPEPGWTRVEIRAEQLDWVPGVLIALDADLVVEGPDELRDRMRSLARRLLAAGEQVADPATAP